MLTVGGDCKESDHEMTFPCSLSLMFICLKMQAL